jgi:hypothetical protein
MYRTSLICENLPPTASQASHPLDDGVPASSMLPAISRLDAHAGWLTNIRTSHPIVAVLIDAALESA